MKWEQLVGKTIKSVDTTSAINVVVIEFTDNTQVFIDAIPVGHGIYAPSIEDSEGYAVPTP